MPRLEVLSKLVLLILLALEGCGHGQGEQMGGPDQGTVEISQLTIIETGDDVRGTIRCTLTAVAPEQCETPHCSAEETFEGWE